MQVLPTLPVHNDAPFKVYQPVDTPQYNVDFVTLAPMEPQVSLVEPPITIFETSCLLCRLYVRPDS